MVVVMVAAAVVPVVLDMHGNDPTPAEKGVGGEGLQLPTTFRDPAAAYGFPGPSPGGFWFAGGGGGGSYPLNPSGVPGGGVGGPYAGAGDGQGPDSAHGGTDALTNSGSGAGGGKATAAPPNGRRGGNGGSGIVIQCLSHLINTQRIDIILNNYNLQSI